MNYVVQVKLQLAILYPVNKKLSFMFNSFLIKFNLYLF